MTTLLISSTTRSRHSKEEWRQLVNEFHASELSRQEFCETRGVTLSRLEKWIVHFCREVQPQPVSPFMDLGTMSPAPVVPPVSGFEVRLELGGGMVLTLSRS